MAGSGNEHVLRYFEETAFATPPASWAASGIPFWAISPEFSEIRQPAIPNQNYRMRVYHPHKPVPTLKNGTCSFGTYAHGRGIAAVAAPGVQATTFHLADLLRGAWGGRRLGYAGACQAGSTTSALTLDTAEGANVIPGDAFFVADSSDGDRVHVAIAESVAGDVVTLRHTLTAVDSAGAAFTPGAGDTAGAAIVGYLHTRALINRAHAEHKTHAFLKVREASDDVIEALGTKLNLSGIAGVAAGEEVMLQWEGMSATHTNEGLARPADPAASAVLGDDPLVTSLGEDTFVYFGDADGALALVEAHAVTPQPAVASQAVPGVGGVEGRHGYTGTAFDGTGLELVVPFDDAYHQEWHDGQEKACIVQIGTVRGRAIALYWPRLTYRDDPQQGTSTDLAVQTLRLEAREYEGGELAGLSGDGLEQYRSKAQILFSA